MNSQNLWVGNNYAYTEYRPRGVFPMNCRKVMLHKVTKRRLAGNKRDSAIALVEFYDKEGNLTGRQREVRTRELIDFWDDWKAEHDYRIEQRERIALEREEKARKDSNRNAEILQKIVQRTGLDPLDIRVGNRNVFIPIGAIERWLNLGEGE